MTAKRRVLPFGIELLESRIAPASLVVTDLNGDQVKFTASSHSLSGSFSVTPTASGDGRHNLLTVDLSSAPFEGTNFRVTVTKGPNGDGVADIAINAGTNDLGTVKVAADLESITAGSGSSTVLAIKSLTVNSIGRFEGITGKVQGSKVAGSVGALTVKGNVDGTFFSVSSGIGSIAIGGSLLGGSNAQGGDGAIECGSIGKISIKGDLRGGNGEFNGEISSGSNIGTVTVGGSIYGGEAVESGSIFSTSLGKVTVGGSVIGGSGTFSGSLNAQNNVASISIAGSVIGGSGDGSGTIVGGEGSSGGTIGKITIGGSVIGGSGQYSGVLGDTDLLPVSVNLAAVVIGKDIVGGSGAASGGVIAAHGSIGSLTLKGSLIGGDSSAGESGFIESDLHAGIFSIAGSLYGGSLGESGALDLAGGISTLKIGGSLYGAAGTASASVNSSGTIGVLNIHGDILGGSGVDSARVAAPAITTEIIGGIVLPGTGAGSGTVA